MPKAQVPLHELAAHLFQPPWLDVVQRLLTKIAKYSTSTSKFLHQFQTLQQTCAALIGIRGHDDEVVTTSCALSPQFSSGLAHMVLAKSYCQVRNPETWTLHPHYSVTGTLNVLSLCRFL